MCARAPGIRVLGVEVRVHTPSTPETTYAVYFRSSLYSS